MRITKRGAAEAIENREEEWETLFLSGLKQKFPKRLRCWCCQFFKRSTASGKRDENRAEEKERRREKTRAS